MSRARTEKLTLGGEAYELRWDMNAIAAYEEITGQNALVVISLTVRGVRAAIWGAMDAAAAVKDGSAPLTLREVGSLLDEDGIEAAMPIVSRLIGLNMPELKEDDATPPGATVEPPPPSPTGTPSAESTSDSPSESSGS